VAALQGDCPATINVVMLGPPGAGKGTQAERLSRTRKVPKISTGDILREAVQSGTAVGRTAKETMEAGSLVGDDIMIAIVHDRLNRPDAHCGFVLDGFPRTVVQATALDRMMADRGPLVVLNMVVPEDVLVRRLATRRICRKCGANAAPEWTKACGKCGGTLITRVDDGIDIVRERLKVYQRQTQPLVEYYSKRSTFTSIDGNRPADVVAAAVDAALDAAIGAAGHGVAQ
jgi:adenylate kinase